MPLNVLPEPVIRGADRAHVWFNVLLAITLALSLPVERTWQSEPIWAVARKAPWAPYSWAIALAVAVTIYTWGSFLSYDNNHRGRVIIVGAVLCFAWYMAMALCVARESYVLPQRVSGFWAVLLFFMALMYGHRAVLYGNTLTGTRWATDPFQLYDIFFLMLVSLAQVLIGVSPNSVQAQFDKNTQLSLAAANFAGAAIAMVGLHLKDLETGLLVELWGYLSLSCTLAFYCIQLITTTHVPNAQLGFTLSEAFVFASLHRAIQIARYKYLRRRGRHGIADRIFKQVTHGFDAYVLGEGDRAKVQQMAVDQIVGDVAAADEAEGRNG